MRIFYTSDEFTYKGYACRGIPFLCEGNMEFVPEVNDYLLWIALENSSTRSPMTWKSQAESLCDFFSWLRANQLAWDAKPQKGRQGEEISTPAIYRNWSLELSDPRTGRRQLQASTVRKRLTHIMAFYKWAARRGRIDFVPWETRDYVLAPQIHPDMYRHTHVGRVVERDNLRPTVRKKLIPLLTVTQCRALLNACTTETLQLMTRLMLQTGLRNAECRTFPKMYVFDPSPALRNRRIPINLDPLDMELKNGKARRIYVSWHLMKDMFDYLNFGEGASRSRTFFNITGEFSSVLFLNHGGTRWSEKGLNNAYRKLWAPRTLPPPRLEFRVTPHMLRHTFATCELFAESQRVNLGHALAWVRDRLGHSSISTTTHYVHCLDLFGETDLNEYQREIDGILAGGEA
ncbi:Tyrosine recombinase XerC [Pandoraea iniqua]|uniref:Tyrosine recombinase XerC n=1 Tax=Pandoraea iniqua TaxID=2508288 RepID=A0A5E4YCA4_9BURK|nr:tyrosine-type recombinase/integrase [Pandoraea iniqua]VVE46092.1 Tyrosine recombinase XerC [Pandoraea iniqua]